MSDIMRPVGFGTLMNWILEEYGRYGSIFGVSKTVRHENGQALPIFEEKIESPFGPAAGPNTQLAQNIIASYAAGARFFELKTVQVMDGAELSACVNKPCITAGDEGYNCEWSTELYVPQAYEEYVKAWVACKLISKEYGLGDPDAFVFNMSVGYDLEGIKSEKVDTFIEGMKEAGDSPVFKECINWALENISRFKNIDEAYVKGISSRISASITESTLHGCPPDEIERIASYLLTEKHLNTFIKCNPTLLGYEYARKRLNSLGFDYIAFDTHHFDEDLQWADAIPMLRRLQKLADEKGLEFGVKLTNTFPVDVAAGELPSEEMYMSGRSLYPLTVHLARLLSEEFGGKLRISYSGGAAAYNIRQLFDAGIWPITMATDILKPGGYQRMSQIGQMLMDCGNERFSGVSVEKIQAIDDGISSDKHYRKSIKPLPDRHIKKKLPLFDCFTSPCRYGCPIHQDIPAYLQAMADGDAYKAIQIITERNPLPFITGTICPHHCGDKCVRNYYEESLHIRQTKLAAAESAFETLCSQLRLPAKNTDGRNVAIVGGGPAGLSAAYFLSRAGIPVTVFDRKDSLGGVVRNVIPEFRIPSESIDKDVWLCTAYGAEFVTGMKVSSVKYLKEEGYTDIIIAVGAWKSGDAHLKYGQAEDAVEFLEKFKNGEACPGKNVVVIGGGNTAMDAARAAKRAPGVESVRLVYRRTRRYMPADEEELQMALDDGVEFMELLAPVGVKDGVLKCSVMELGEADESGRRTPVDTGRTQDIPADTLIAAVGERIDDSLYKDLGIETDRTGRPAVDENMMTSVPGVYAAGDSRRGPATVVEAISDAARAAAAIAGISFDKYADQNAGAAPIDTYKAKKGDVSLDTDSMPDKRCLGCPAVCEICADVCPNRANIAIRVPGKSQEQILHIDSMCNECGNCAVFCPYDGRPYKDKFTLFGGKEDFDDSENEGFLPGEDGRITLRLDGKVYETDMEGVRAISPDAAALISAVYKDYEYILE